MNEVLRTIKKRRSTRGFTDIKVSKDDLEIIINAGIDAPNAMNAQDWYFTAVQNKDLLEEINNSTKNVLPEELNQRMLDRFNGNPDYNVFYNAPTLIFSFAKEETKHYSLLNCSFASQNMVLASESLGYSSCYIGMLSLLFQDKQYYEKLNVPKGYTIATIIAVGLSAVNMSDVERDYSKVSYIY